ncbi:phage holin, LLH family [Paenibacillus taichungensis]|uniref:phage holin, LLH family n=1 Tax=Paenibacillus taichungensis TaxID=484184 RepID=UPI0039A4A419
MDTVWNELARPVITDVLFAVITLFIAAVGIFLLRKWKELGKYITAKRQATKALGTESLQNTLWSIAQEAYVKAEYAAEKLAGSEKMDVALNYALDKLRGLGINHTRDEVKTKIQEAWVKLDKVPNQQGTTSVVPQITISHDNANPEAVAKVLRAEIEKAVQSG